LPILCVLCSLWPILLFGGGMATSTYSVDDERQINFNLKKILDLLSVQVPDDHFGLVEIAFPRQNGKIAGEVEVKLRSRYKRGKTAGE
jgi:hypothetical protein